MILGVKVYYADGSIHRIFGDDLQGQWPKVPADGVQVVRVYHARTYDTWNPEARRFEARCFTDTYTSHDYYFFTHANEFGACNLTRDIPAGAIPKLGSEINKARWLEIYNRAHNDHTF